VIREGQDGGGTPQAGDDSCAGGKGARAEQSAGIERKEVERVRRHEASGEGESSLH